MASATPPKQSAYVDVTDEATPLLGASQTAVSRDGSGNAIPAAESTQGPDHGSLPDNVGPSTPTSMPYAQILLLCYASLADPVSYFGIFPFVNEMIQLEGNIAEENVGFWAGAIESLFSLVQMFLMMFYGRMADRVGRKPVMIFSLIGISFSTAMFGLSKSLWQMIFFRCMAGVFAGSVVTIRTMISENTDKQTQGRAFSWYMFSRNLGILLGPLIGGPLANPSVLFPGTFGHVKFFIDYPYALATFVAAAVCLSGAILSLLFLKETLRHKEDGSLAEPPMSTMELLKTPGVGMVLYIFNHTLGLAIAYTAVNPVFLFTRIEKGGLSFDPKHISYTLAIAGASQALWMLLAFPFLQRRWGTGNLLRITAIAWPIAMALYPVANEFRRHGLDSLFWISFPVLLILGSGVAMSFACIQLCLNDISPSPAVLGTLNALSLAIHSGVRAVEPALFTSIFAFGVKIKWADGHLVWVVLVALGLALSVAVYYLPEAAEGRPEKKRDPSTADDSGQ